MHKVIQTYDLKFNVCTFNLNLLSCHDHHLNNSHQIPIIGINFSRVPFIIVDYGTWYIHVHVQCTPVGLAYTVFQALLSKKLVS
jgi:hypothetical protein